jgi:hypothetical protein
MPSIAYGEPGSGQNQLAEFKNIDHGYEYPEGLDLRPGHKLHDELVGKIHKRAQDSAKIMSGRFQDWNSTDEILTAYKSADAEEEDIKKDDDRKPVSIVFPYSYAIMETLLSYLIAAYYQDPIFHYEGTSPEDVLGAIMLEKAIDVHCVRSKVLLNLHTHFRDGLAYGFGVAAPGWKKEMGWKTQATEKGFFSNLKNAFVAEGLTKSSVRTTLYEGNELANIDPYLCLPDVNVPITEVQKGEYFGWVDKTNYFDLLSKEETDPDVFNVRYLEKFKNRRSSIFNIDQSGRNKKVGMAEPRESNYTRPTEVINMFIKIIPKKWKVGNAEYPQKWHFRLAADSILTAAKPMGLNHDKFPITINAPDFDGYSSTPVSRMEILNGLQGVLDWLFNAHIANVRKAVNDMLVYDPYLLNSDDLENPEPGKLIRSRRPAWGRGVKDSIMQLQVNDITRQHINDSGFVVNFMQKIGAADDATMGSLRQGGPERLTKGEFQGTRVAAFSRLERIAKIVGVQSLQDMGYFFAHHTQQMMSKELYVQTTGRWQETLMKSYPKMVRQGRMKVDPFKLLVEYDLKVRDGTIPNGNFSEIWLKMFETLANPESALGQTFDIVKIFRHIATNAGAKNVDEFIRVEVQEEEQVQDQVQRGNLVPIEAGGVR